MHGAGVSVNATEGFLMETDIGKRWEQGIDHHPKSIELYKQIEDIAFRYADDAFCFKSGGDGDNGETLMYILDLIFESQDENIVL